MNEEKTPLRSIAWSYLVIALSSIGGGLSGWVQQEIVEKRRWLTTDEFLSGLALCQILPGPNQINFAVHLGTRLRGFAGAAAALSGLLVLPMLIAVFLAMIYLQYQNIGLLQRIVHGMAAAAAAMTLSMGIRLLRPYLRRWQALVVMGGAFIGSGLLHYPLVAILIVLVPVSLVLEYIRVAPVRRQEDGS